MVTAGQYIYYTQRHLIRDEASQIANLTKETKQGILKNAIKKQNKRKQKLLSVGDLSDSQKDILDDFLNNNSKWVDELNQVSLKDSSAEQSYPATYEAAMTLYNNISKKTITQKQFISQLNNFLNVVEKEYLGNNGILKDYTNYVTKEFINNKRLGGPKINQKAGGSVSGRIIESIVNKTRSKAFKVSNYTEINSSSKKLDSALLKLTALKAALGKSANFGGGFSYIASKKDSKEYWDEVKQVTMKLVGDFRALVGEQGALQNIVKGSEKTKNLFEKMENELHMTLDSTHYEKGVKDGVFFTSFLKEDPRLKEDLEKIVELEKAKGSIYSVFNTTSNQPKADISIFGGNNSVTGKLGISVKDYEEYVGKDGLTKVKIDLQSSTPLLTLMLRECEYSYDDLTTFINIGAARPVHPAYHRPETRYENALSNMWEKIKENIQYRATLSALAGFGGKYEEVYYLDFNNNVISVSDVLDHLLNTLSYGSSIKFSSVKGDGLDRAVYQKMNEANYVLGKRNSANSESRSNATRTDAIAKLYKTKVDIALNLTQIQALGF